MGVTRCTSECLGLPAGDCEGLWGCSWTNATNASAGSPGLGSCSAGGAGESTIWIGILLSLIGDIVINVGMNCMKHAHNKNTREDGSTLKHFALIPWWWAGIVGIVGGEVANIIAYGYAPASIVTPMGAVGVLTNVLITTFLLHEPFYRLQLVGIVLVVAGIVCVVVFAPSTSIRIESATIWEDWMFTVEFLVWFSVLTFLLPVFLLLGKKYGETTVLIHLTSCALMSSITIVCAKTFSTLLKSGLEEGFEHEWTSPTPYIALVVMVLTAVGSMGFVNKAMMIFGNSVVVPIYYALFTVVSVGSVAWVYREFDCLKDKLQIAIFLLGVGFTVIGVMLLQFGAKDNDADGDEEKGYVEGSGFNNPKRAKMSAVWGSGFNGAAVVYPLAPYLPSVFNDAVTNRRHSEAAINPHHHRHSLIGYVPSKPLSRHTMHDRSGSFFSSNASSVFSRGGVNHSLQTSINSREHSANLGRSQSSRAGSGPVSLLGTHPPRSVSVGASGKGERIRGAGVESPMDRMEEEGSESPDEDSRSPLLGQSKAHEPHDNTDKAVIFVNLSACAPTGPPIAEGSRQHSPGADAKVEPPTVLTCGSASAGGSVDPDAMSGRHLDDAEVAPAKALTGDDASVCSDGDTSAWSDGGETAGHECVVDVGESSPTTLKSSVTSGDAEARGQEGAAGAPAEPLHSESLGGTGQSRMSAAASFCSRRSSIMDECSIAPSPPSQCQGSRLLYDKHEDDDEKAGAWHM